MEALRFDRVHVRRGGSPEVVRNTTRWEAVLSGHTEKQHAGKVSRDCAACRELTLRIKTSRNQA